MKQNIILAVLSLRTCLTGITGCSASNTATKAEVQTYKKIKLNTVGSIYPTIKALAKAYKTNNSQTQITFLPKRMFGSGIAAVKKGIVEIATVSRELKQKEYDGSIIYRQIAQEFLNFAFSREGSNILRQSSLEL